MSLNQSQVKLLGANELEYSQVASEEEEREQFNWASNKIALINQTLRTLHNLNKVADIGCRTGKEAAFYKEQANIPEMYGFDISEIPLQKALQRGIHAQVWVSGVSPCPVTDNFFDAVIAGDLIEHLFDTDLFLEELYRVVKPGGYLLITTPNLAWWWSRLRFLFGKVPAGMGSVSSKHSKDPAIDIKHLRVSVNREWQNLFIQHGFECLSIAGYYYPGLLREPFNGLDRILTARYPSLAHSNLFLLKKLEFKK